MNKRLVQFPTLVLPGTARLPVPLALRAAMPLRTWVGQPLADADRPQMIGSSEYHAELAA